MATVTAFNAERTKEIEDSAIVGGTIVEGNLILLRHDGQTVDAGPIMEIGGEPFVGQYATANRPPAFENANKVLWDTTQKKFYMSDGVSWVVFIREVVAGDNIFADDYLPGQTEVSVLPSPSFVGSASALNGMSIGKTHSGLAGPRLEFWGVSPSIESSSSAGTAAVPLPTLSGAIIFRIIPHSYHSGSAFTTGDCRLEIIATENHTPTAQGSRWRMWSKANGTTAAVEAHIWDQDGSYTAKRPLGGIGYGAGAGASVTQITSRTTPVIINNVCGRITLIAATMATGVVHSFVVNNSTVRDTDVIMASVAGAGSSPGYYQAWADEVVAGAFNMNIRNVNTGSAPSEAVAINFSILRSVIA